MMDDRGSGTRGVAADMRVPFHRTSQRAKPGAAPVAPLGVSAGRHVAFLRAVNVAGHGRILMSDLREIFVAAGAANARTFIQSGNVVFDAASRDADAIVEQAGRSLGALLGERPVIIVRTGEQLSNLVALSPFEHYQPDALLKRYVVFLENEPTRIPSFPLIDEKERLEAIGVNGRDVFVVSRRKPNRFFGFPNAFVERAFGSVATSRNWSTVERVAKLD